MRNLKLFKIPCTQQHIIAVYLTSRGHVFFTNILKRNFHSKKTCKVTGICLQQKNKAINMLLFQ